MELLFFLVITFIAITIPLLVFRKGKEWLIALTPIYLITGNVFAESFLQISVFLTSLAVPIYSASFFITDLLNEHYGKKAARNAVILGFVGQLFFVLIMILIINAPIFPEKLETYQSAFLILPRLIIGSFTAYLFSQFWDIFIYHYIKDKTGEDRLIWLRNNISTMTSQLIDTTIFVTIAFYGVPPFNSFIALFNFILTTWFIKMLVASIDTPYIYFSRWLVRRKK